MGSIISIEDENWQNIVIHQLQPKINQYLNDLNPVLKQILGLTSDLSLEFNQDVPIIVRNLKEHNNSLDFDLTFKGGLNLDINVLGTHSGIRGFEMSAKSRLVFKPKINKIPFIGGLQFCFLTEPKIAFDLDGVAGLIEVWPRLKSMVKIFIKKP